MECFLLISLKDGTADAVSIPTGLEICDIVCVCVCTRVCMCVFVHVCSATSSSVQAHGLLPTRLLCPWDSPGKNTRVGCHFLLQGIFLTQGSNLRLLLLLHFRQILYHCAHHLGSPLLLIRSINYFNGEKLNGIGSIRLLALLCF